MTTPVDCESGRPQGESVTQLTSNPDRVLFLSLDPTSKWSRIKTSKLSTRTHNLNVVKTGMRTYPTTTEVHLSLVIRLSLTTSTEISPTFPPRLSQTVSICNFKTLKEVYPKYQKCNPIKDS